MKMPILAVSLFSPFRLRILSIAFNCDNLTIPVNRCFIKCILEDIDIRQTSSRVPFLQCPLSPQQYLDSAGLELVGRFGLEIHPEVPLEVLGYITDRTQYFNGGLTASDSETENRFQGQRFYFVPLCAALYQRCSIIFLFSSSQY